MLFTFYESKMTWENADPLFTRKKFSLYGGQGIATASNLWLFFSWKSQQAVNPAHC